MNWCVMTEYGSLSRAGNDPSIFIRLALTQGRGVAFDSSRLLSHNRSTPTIRACKWTAYIKISFGLIDRSKRLTEQATFTRSHVVTRRRFIYQSMLMNMNFPVTENSHLMTVVAEPSWIIWTDKCASQRSECWCKQAATVVLHTGRIWSNGHKNSSLHFEQPPKWTWYLSRHKHELIKTSQRSKDRR